MIPIWLMKLCEKTLWFHQTAIHKGAMETATDGPLSRQEQVPVFITQSDMYPTIKQPNRYLVHQNMPMTTGVSHKQQKKWVKWMIINPSCNGLKTTKTSIIQKKGLCSPANITEYGSIWMIITDTDLPKDQNGLICFVFFKIFPE